MGKQPDINPRDLVDYVAKLERRIKSLEQRSPFTGTGVHPNGAQGLDSDNYVPATSGFSLNGGTGRAEFKDIVLYDLPNSMLANPSGPFSVYDYATNFALPTTLTNLRTYTVPVPAGFTQAAVTLTARIYAVNGTAGLDYLYSQANINGYNGLAMPVAATGSGGSCMNVSTFSAVLPASLLGSNLVLQVAGQVAFGAWPANASNQLDLSASVTWYR